MALAPHYQPVVDEFFAYLEKLGDAFPLSQFSYAALRRGADFVLLHGRLHLSAFPLTLPATHYRCENARVGSYQLSELKMSPRQLFDALMAGKVSTPDGDILFPPEDNGQHGAYHMPYHQEGLQSQGRLSVLGLTGLRNPDFIKQPQLDWEIRASATPYDSLQELLYIYQLGQFFSDALRVEFVANTIIEVDLAAKVEGVTARPAVLLSKTADPKKASLGYMVFDKGQVVQRGSIPSSDLTWTETDRALRGEGSIAVPAAAHIRAIAVYDGMAQRLGWIADPTSLQNSRRAAYEQIDPKLAKLTELVKNTQEKVRKARDLELVVSWLLWMMGFSPAHFGHLAETQDAADVFAATPQGHIAVVECTTGLIKSNKLSLLFERAQAVRAQLQASGNKQLRVIAAMVSTKKRADIASTDFEDAAKQGILIFTLEDLEQAVEQTRLAPNADQSFTEAEQAIETAFNRYNAQGTLNV